MTGSMISAYYLSCFPYPSSLKLWVNLSGRYDMSRILRDVRYASTLRTEDGKGYKEDAVVHWKVKVAGKEAVHRITAEGVSPFLLLDGCAEQVADCRGGHS